MQGVGCVHKHLSRWGGVGIDLFRVLEVGLCRSRHTGDKCLISKHGQ